MGKVVVEVIKRCQILYGLKVQLASFTYSMNIGCEKTSQG